MQVVCITKGDGNKKERSLFGNKPCWHTLLYLQHKVYKRVTKINELPGVPLLAFYLGPPETPSRRQPPQHLMLLQVERRKVGATSVIKAHEMHSPLLAALFRASFASKCNLSAPGHLTHSKFYKKG